MAPSRAECCPWPLPGGWLLWPPLLLAALLAGRASALENFTTTNSAEVPDGPTTATTSPVTTPPLPTTTLLDTTSTASATATPRPSPPAAPRPSPTPGRPAVRPLSPRLAEAVRRIEAGEAPDEFYWGRNLGPHQGSWRTMLGKVAGCLLHKAEAIAVENDLPVNGSHTTHEHIHFFRNLCQDLAACCTRTSRKGWCLQHAGPAYSRLVPLAEEEDHGHSDGTEPEVMAWAFAQLARAAGQLLQEIGSGCSARGQLLLSACPQGPEECSPSALERLRQQLLTS